MWDYWFVDNESGEEFFVECATKEEAWAIATESFNEINLELLRVITPAEAEFWGLDTY
jgi:hypothetical protein